MTRRGFLAGSIASGALGADAAPPPDWFDRPMRWAQLAFVENDPARYDPQFWIDYLRRIHADAACLSAGGCVAFYPTKIPFHHRSRFLGDKDPFGDLTAACRKMNMVVVARTDPHATYDDVAAAHPDWIAVDSQGRPRRHWASPEMWVTCAFGPYNFEFMTDVTREIVELYNVDGVFSNRWAGHGQCWCVHCKRNFREFSGMDLPTSADPRDPARRQYILWRQKRLFDLWRLWDAEIRKSNPRARYIANSGGGALSDLDMKTVGELSATLAADRQARRGLTPPWAAGKNAKEYRATLGRKAIMGISSVGLEEPYRWKDSVQSPHEIKLWMADGVANGFRPWFTKFGLYLYDRRWLKPVEEFYTWHWRNERYLRNEEPLARVAMVYSQQTATFYGGERARQKVEDHALGMYHALIEARIPFEMVHDGLLDPAHVSQYKLLLLPNIAALSDSQCAHLRDFVDRGGSIVATHETSLYDEWGGRRNDFGLSALFGATFRGRVEGPMQNSYLNIAPGHPLVAGLEDAGRIINGVSRVDAGPDGPAPLTLVPSYPDLPMEMVYPRQERTNVRGIFFKEAGRGRVVYFPWDIDRTYWEVMSPDHGRLLANAIRWALNEDPQVTVTGPGLIEVTAWRQKDSITVHLINLSNPMMMKGPYQEFLPLPPQTVTITLPQGRTAKSVRLLSAGRAAAAKERGGRVVATVPPFRLHEVVAIDL